MRIPLLLSLLPAFVLALTPADYSAYTLFESHPAPEGWRQLSTAPSPSTPITLRFHLTTSYSDLERELLTVSDPTHPRYGDYRSRESLAVLTAPANNAVETVLEWLQSTTPDVTVDGDVIKVRLTIAEAEHLLRTKYATFQNDDDGRTLVRTLSYSVPEVVKPYLATVQPTNMFTLRKLNSHIVPLHVTDAENERLAPFSAKAEADFSIASAPSCNATVTLECLAALYGFADYDATGKADVGVSGFLEQYAQYDDLQIFLQKYRPEAVGTNFTVVSVNGGQNLQNVNGTDNISEANLDIQYAVGISYPAKNTYYTTAGRPPFIPDLDVTINDSEPYLEYLEYLLKQDKLPTVISTSYGESEQTVPLSYRHTVCDLLGRLGARGVSVIFSAGDSGPGWSCRSNDGKNTPKFLPQFPAACPWVTSVVRHSPTSTPEEAVSTFTLLVDSPRPGRRAWAAVYKVLLTGAAVVFSADVRRDKAITIRGDTAIGAKQLIGGTSASAPMFSGIIALVNDYRLTRWGKKPPRLLEPSPLQPPRRVYGHRQRPAVPAATEQRGENQIAGSPAIIPGGGMERDHRMGSIDWPGNAQVEVLKNI
ncbi:putative Tripeptidyl-peptidase sed2 [Sphaerosporella brunnea]|uniref:tripeptidyl-peptidase II n=1 Tax=Sphaerosporella brunnea TaxID=1250544 RepID=A0A5J5EQN7_9PEZI|nr:putative Tripeptidyl-peptidase sed2 [Sphaerosporella brunnea]